MAAARSVAALGIAALCIDTAPRPQAFGPGHGGGHGGAGSRFPMPMLQRRYPL